MPQPNATLEDLEIILHEQEGCPICHYGRQSGRKYLDGVMYESVNDFGLRQRLIKNMGFCEFHSQEMLTFPGAKLGAAIIEQAMLKEALRRMEATSPGRNSFFSRGSKSDPSHSAPDRNTCPACLHEQASERRAIEDLLTHWDDDWAGLLEESGGMCFNHLVLALHLAPKATAKTLKQMHERQWRELIARLDEFIRKQDYRFRQEVISEEEGVASRRTIAILTGEPRSVIQTKLVT